MIREKNIKSRFLYAFAALVVFGLMLTLTRSTEAQARDEYVFEINIDGGKNVGEFKIFYGLATGSAIAPAQYLEVGTSWAEGVPSKWADPEFGGGATIDMTAAVNALKEAESLDDSNINFCIDIQTAAYGSKPQKRIMYASRRITGEDRWEEYDVFDPENPDSAAQISDDKNHITYYISLNEETNAFCVGLAYPFEGDRIARDYIEGELFAYGGDLTGDGSVNVNDIRLGIAAELCTKYFWDEGGILDETFEIHDPEDLILENSPFNSGEDRVAITDAGTYTANLQDGSTTSLNKYSYTINLGYDPEGNPVVATGYAYALRSTEDVLVYDGHDFYVRDIVGDGEGSDCVAFGRYGETPTACVSTAYFNQVKINGNGFKTDNGRNPSNSEVLYVNTNNDDFIQTVNAAFGLHMSLWSNQINLRIIGQGKKYAIVEPYSDTEGGVIHAGDLDMDAVCQTGSGHYTELYAGNEQIKITSLNGAIMSNQLITNVSSGDSSMAGAVTIAPFNTESTDEGFIVTFNTKYYDEVPLVITYEDGQTAPLTIKRLALKVYFGYLADPETSSDPTFYFDFDNTQLPLTYNYDAGQQILIYATYYQNDGSNDQDFSLFLTKAGGVTEVKQRKYTKAASDGNASETYFVLGFVPAHEWDELGQCWTGNIHHQNVGAWDAIVLNSGYDDADSFGGAGIGRGAGVHWDGNVDWTF